MSRELNTGELATQADPIHNTLASRGIFDYSPDKMSFSWVSLTSDFLKLKQERTENSAVGSGPAPGWAELAESPKALGLTRTWSQARKCSDLGRNSVEAGRRWTIWWLAVFVSSLFGAIVWTRGWMVGWPALRSFVFGPDFETDCWKQKTKSGCKDFIIM